MSTDSFGSAVSDCVAALDKLGLPYAIIGGVAVISYGVARATADVDATIPGESLDLDALLSTLEQSGFQRRLPDAAAFARQAHVLLLRHRESQVPIDLTLAWLPFELDMLRSVEHRDFAGVSIPVPSVTDLLIMKLVAHRPKDLGDAEFLVRAQTVDLIRVRRVLSEFCTLLEDDERLSTLDRLEATRAGNF